MNIVLNSYLNEGNLQDTPVYSKSETYDSTVNTVLNGNLESNLRFFCWEFK